MDEKRPQEEFDTGISKIRHEIKSRLVAHGLYGSVTFSDAAASDGVPAGSDIAIVVKGKTVTRTFDRNQIEACCLRVGGPVLAGIKSMVEELAA